MKISEIKELTEGEIAAKVIAMETELFKLKFQHGIRQLDNTAKLSLIKKDIARLKTIKRQKALTA